jgi:hypothetical protein
MAKRGLRFTLVICALALASCVSPEELRREDEATCTGYGFHAGTDAFANCLQKESLARRYWAAPPPPVLGLGLGRTLGAVLALAGGGSEPAVSRTRMSSAVVPRTAASAILGSAPCLTSAFDQLVWPGGR